jgi:hypothetical protein
MLLVLHVPLVHGRLAALWLWLFATLVRVTACAKLAEVLQDTESTHIFGAEDGFLSVGPGNKPVDHQAHNQEGSIQPQVPASHSVQQAMA